MAGFVHYWVGDHTGGPICNGFLARSTAGVFTREPERVGCASCRQSLVLNGTVPPGYYDHRDCPYAGDVKSFSADRGREPGPVVIPSRLSRAGGGEVRA